MNLIIFSRQIKHIKSRGKWGFIILGIVICLVITWSGRLAVKNTSSDKYCVSCHIHPVADHSWKLSTHYNNSSGSIVHCAECHLPPEGKGYLFAKAKHGFKDVYGYLFKDSAGINWEEKKLLENARGFVYESSCLRCHQNLFPATLSVDGGNAHIFYTTDREQLNCINCHLNVGHYDRYAIHAHDTGFGVNISSSTIFTEPAKVEKFVNFTEMIPGTDVSFDMVAVDGGTFNMGSPENEPLRRNDEGPVRKVTLSKFWIAKTEVTWDEYLAFFRATSSQGRLDGAGIISGKTDAITGATPPWGAPDQGWGKGSRPAITMSWYAANVYCRWLSEVTGKKYRLPTEAEWEFACRGGTSTPYFFPGNPKKFSSEGLLRKVIRPDTTTIGRLAVYKENSQARTQEPEHVGDNPFGLKNMSGNVYEFCSDFYAPDAYGSGSPEIVNPSGPERGAEHVVRGGSFRSDAAELRSAARNYTKTAQWLVTDPQMPKSIWWYSDCIDVGFRVVCEADTVSESFAKFQKGGND
jgi:formylglycine-generating enzyme required for sulfatase activity/nitrate/TMAO reductase-like tetraheme cytochrome c subunit